MKKFLLFTSIIVLSASNSIFAFANESDINSGLRKYEENKGNTVCWNDEAKEISVYKENALLYSTNIGSSSIDLEDFSLQLNYTVDEKNGTTYLKQETLDFINSTLFPVQDNKEYGYSITTEFYKNDDESITINYPKIINYKGELIQDYMNQSIYNLVEKYIDSDIYDSVSLDYSIEKSDDKVISILFTGVAKAKSFNNSTNIMDSINLDLNTSNEISLDNFIKDKEMLNDILESNSLKPLEYGSLKFYFKDDNVVFYYKPLDDSINLPHVIVVGIDELSPIINSDFGDRPAS